jgi:hypothetical protein
MYVKIDDTKYTEISKLQFEPETDVTGSTVPINEMWVSIKTDDYVNLSSRVSLYDDLDHLWCKYWVTYAEREDAYNVRVHGVSALARLDSVTMAPKMYDNQSVSSVLWEILGPLSGEYSMDSSFNSQRISGYCPKQSARVRLQWVCMVIGAYLKNYFNTTLEILPVSDDTEAVIPMADTYWKPKVTYKDHVTAITATYYEYTEGTPSRTDDYVEVNGVTYIQTETQVTLTNDDVPVGATENVLELDGVTLINQSNVSTVLSFIAKYKFKRTEVDLECINNGNYLPGQRVYAYADEDTMVQGYVGSCSFDFGLQAKASMHLTPVEVKESTMLTIRYMWGTKQVGMRVFRFPLGYSYEVENPYLEASFAGHRYVFWPENETATGTMVDGGVEDVQQVQLALDAYNGDLTMYAVDGIVQTEGDAVVL